MTNSLTESERVLLGEVSPDSLWQSVETIAQWQRISGTPDERAAVDYLQRMLTEYGLRTSVYEFESLLGWPEEAHLEVVSPTSRPLEAITHALVPSTPPEGLEAEVVYLGSAEESDFARQPVAGKIAMLDGMAAPLKVLRGQTHGVAGLIFVAADRLHDMCVSPVWGTPTTKTADLLPRIPVVSITRAGGDEMKALLGSGSVAVRMRTRTFWGWRKVPLLVAEIAGAQEPERFVLLSGHHCSWYYGAMDNGAANATMLEVARILASHRHDLRRSVRIAFWPGHTQGRYTGSTWYFDNFWEDLHDNCVLHVNVDSTGAKGARFYHSLSMPETREFALEAIRDAIGVEAKSGRQSRAGDQSFWGCGVPSIWMDLSQVPAELAADLGGSGLFTAAGEGSAHKQSGLPWWWHTPEDTLDKLDPEVLRRDTQVYLLATLRAAARAFLPFQYAPAVKEIGETLMRYHVAAAGRFDLEPAVARADELARAAETLDGLLKEAQSRPDAESAASEANADLMRMDRHLVHVNFSGNGPFDQDLAIPIPAVPRLEPARRLKEMDPSSDEARYLVTELTRNRNQVTHYLKEALGAAAQAENTLRRALDQKS